MKIGIFDSGLGGLCVLKEMIRKYPNVQYIYYGDTFYLPYGSKTKEELIRLGMRIIRFFEEQKVDQIIIACGTCSSLVEEYRKMTTIPIYDVITYTLSYIKENYHEVALLATESTIQNGIFEKRLKENGIISYPMSCPSFVPYLEGMIESENFCVDYDLEKLKEKKFEVAILGCTHYPLLKKEIENYLKVPTIDMGVCLASTIKIEKSVPFSLTIYMSKITKTIEKNTCDILNLDIKITQKNLPV